MVPGWVSQRYNLHASTDPTMCAHPQTRMDSTLAGAVLGSLFPLPHALLSLIVCLLEDQMFCPFPGTLRRLFLHPAKSCWVPGHSWSRAQGGFHLIHGTHSHCKPHSMCISLLHSSAHAPGLHGLACLKGT